MATDDMRIQGINSPGIHQFLLDILAQAPED